VWLCNRRMTTPSTTTAYAANSAALMAGSGSRSYRRGSWTLIDQITSGEGGGGQQDLTQQQYDKRSEECAVL
jgi:hypothetical protein